MTVYDDTGNKLGKYIYGDNSVHIECYDFNMTSDNMKNSVTLCSHLSIEYKDGKYVVTGEISGDKFIATNLLIVRDFLIKLNPMKYKFY